jgi:hypothetical protein
LLLRLPGDILDLRGQQLGDGGLISGEEVIVEPGGVRDVPFALRYTEPGDAARLVLIASQRGVTSGENSA